jgi:imidazolonepropionase-like amidohydrolase
MTQNVVGISSRSAQLLAADSQLSEAMHHLPGELLSAGYTDDDRALGPVEFERMLAFVNLAWRAGVPIAVGTDSPSAGGVIPGLAYHNELELLVAAGLSPLDALTCATRNGARLLRREADFGTLTGGRLADIVVLGRDPLLDIRNTLDIRAVFQGGQQLVDNSATVST